MARELSVWRMCVCLVLSTNYNTLFNSQWWRKQKESERLREGEYDTFVFVCIKAQTAADAKTL